MDTTHEPGKEEIISAAERIRPYIHRTPVLTCSAIDEISGASIFFKCENLQKAGAFKSRGAVNAVFSYDSYDIKQGVATHSSGNHAAALARAAQLKHIPAYIVMPENSSKVKVAAVKNYGGKITFCQPTLEAREEKLNEVLNETNAFEIHPYNNYAVITGQATAALELIEDYPNLDTIIAPVGGGGLLSGTALATHYFSPNTKVIAAEPTGADDAYQSFYQKKLIPSVNPDTIADGLRTSLGSLTFPIIRHFVHDIVTVNDQATIEAMKLVWERMKIIIEPSSAVALAIILKHRHRFEGLRIGIIISGGNVDLMHLPWL
ncbi:MAG: pyridoxal-phosphate dependent enzyme [Bacteroidales bacterium]|nr:pyridoxal-phosphate dependent enzyme [Bacteroidales bacterium]